MAFYNKPQYIENAAKRKYGRGIFVIGATQDNIAQFFNKIKQNALSAKPPEEVGRAVVDIDCKSHINQADGRDASGEDKPDDWFDVFEITSKKGTSESRSKSYQLQLTSSKQTSVNAGLNFKVGGSGFFNMAGVPISPEVGAGGGFSRTTTDTKQTTESDTKKEALSQEYQVVDRLKVPPRTKVAAKITTYAVTYESKIRTKLTIDAQAFIPICFRTRFSQMLGGICTSVGMLTAEDIFVNEENFKSEDGYVTFERDGKISYLGEEVEITKEKIGL